MSDLIPIDIYKDPLTENKEGFGYLGCLMQTPEKDKLQCHICGELHGYLALHLRGHNITTKEYRKKFGLMHNTSLVSSTVAEKYLKRFLDFGENKLLEWRTKGLAKSHANPIKMKKGEGRSLEYKNKASSCPEQILQEIKTFADKIGRTPTIKDFILQHPQKRRYVELARKTFGSWENALTKLGIVMTTSGRKENTHHLQVAWDKETIIELLQDFTKENKRIPRWTDLLQGKLPDASSFRRYFGGLEKARQEANLQDILLSN